MCSGQRVLAQGGELVSRMKGHTGFCRLDWMAVCGVLVLAVGCSGETTKEPDSGKSDVQEDSPVVWPPEGDAAELVCQGTPCKTIADCGEVGPCMDGIACVDGCCEPKFKEAGTACTATCLLEATCDGGGNCGGGEALVCAEDDGTPCTAPVCNTTNGQCEEVPLEDGAIALTSNCYDNILCQGGKPDYENAVPTELAGQCKAENDSLSPMGCIVSVICVDSEAVCQKVLKDDGTQCFGDGEDAEGADCFGRSCKAGECVLDPALDQACGAGEYPDSCKEECQACTNLTCHWIPDPANPGAPKKKVRYCQPAAGVGAACDDGNACTAGDACVLAGVGDGPLGKESMGQCEGAGTTKEDCLAQMELPALPCLKAGVSCTEESGCAIDQQAANQWCYPPEGVCYNKDNTYCTHIDVGDGKWNSETGCHLDMAGAGSCDDANPCTEDSCVPGGGCEHAPVSGLACFDPGVCLGLCQNGQCVEVAVEVCNGQDDDCDGQVDDGVKNACGGCGAVPPEVCNGQDDNCNGQVDEGSLCQPGFLCQNGQCVQNCAPVDGGWSDWDCPACSGCQNEVTCSRSCTNPVPYCGGAECVGPSSQALPCGGQSGPLTFGAGTKVFDQCGQNMSGTVPAGVTKLQVKLWGGGGGGGAPGGGGGGAFVSGTLAVQTGDTVEVRVGCSGADEGSGGGASYVFLNSVPVMVAAGGGGGGADGCSGCSNTWNPLAGQGGGGGPAGGMGQQGRENNKYDCGTAGGEGGTQNAGGAGGGVNDKSIYEQCTLPGFPGSAHTGGYNQTNQCMQGNAASYQKGGCQSGGNGHGGGGGAGWYGGGGGAGKWTYTGGGGGGGSSYTAAGKVTAVSTEGGNNRTPGGTGDPSYKGNAGWGGQGQTEPFKPELDSTPGTTGLVIVTL